MTADSPTPFFVAEVHTSCVGQGASPGGGNLQPEQGSRGGRRAAHKAQHKER
jgi:hypothetical protein